jgi:23S rRNA pseudouridine1911/1915/1917 synthase
VEFSEHTVAVSAELDGVRVDTGLAKILGISRSYAAEVIETQTVTLNGRSVKKRDELVAGQQLRVVWRPKAEPRVVAQPVDDFHIVYDDDDIVVVSKPAGVAAHPSLGWEGPTVLGALASRGYSIATSGAPERQGIVHRLDQGTSGLMVVAKSEYAYSEMKRQFKAREVTKIYHTVVQGHPDPLTGTIEGPIGRAPQSEWKFAVVSGGKAAVTHYDAIDAFRYGSLLEVTLETGRTHQIRVHMSAQRHPCVGDIVYGADPVLAEKLGLQRQWLHAHRLGFVHPGSAEYVEFESEYSKDLSDALDKLESGETL